MLERDKRKSQKEALKKQGVKYLHQRIYPQEYDVDSLTPLLESFNIPLTDWGRNGTKTVANLLQELLDGESQLHVYERVENGVVSGKELLRKVTKARIRVVFREGNNNWQELYQIFTQDSQGNPIPDDKPVLSGVLEKIIPGEKINDAISRAFREELKIELSEDELKSIIRFGRTTDFRPSHGFPGLNTLYTIYPGIFMMPDLHHQSEHDFEEKTGLKGKFIWRPIESISECFYLNGKFGITK